MSEQDREKTCFVISPIGSQGDLVRLRSDQVLRHIIEPVVSAVGYKDPIRADHIAEPGMITHQIIQHLLEDDLVVADLTGHDPNVFYELAIRHAIRGPIVLLIAEDENPPFDVSQSRAIKFDFRDLDSVANCKTELERQIRHLEEYPDAVEVVLNHPELAGEDVVETHVSASGRWFRCARCCSKTIPNDPRPMEEATKVPYRDPEARKAYQREYQRLRRAGSQTPRQPLIPAIFRLKAARDIVRSSRTRSTPCATRVRPTRWRRLGVSS